jgi:hypothetical protein
MHQSFLKRSARQRGRRHIRLKHWLLGEAILAARTVDSKMHPNGGNLIAATLHQVAHFPRLAHQSGFPR